MKKTLTNTTAKGAKTQVPDIEFWGEGDAFKLISKASSKKEGWMKSTKAMEIPNLGCIVQVTTQQGDNIAEAVTFVPYCRIEEYSKEKGSGEIVARRLVTLTPPTPIEAQPENKPEKEDDKN